mmetsp:Transcript_54009/g.158928  ORF Transcript_54009/g.158928 Transcript_54009/m.158928 type:complete len:288 (-) Transcript_54009:3835-4698(-)
MAWQAVFTACEEALAVLFEASTLICILASSFLASSIGPFASFGSRPCCSLMHADASAAALSCIASSFWTSSRTEAGVAKLATASLSSAFSGSAAASMLFAQASSADIFSAAGDVMASASARSFASTWAFFSACSFLKNSLFPRTTFFFSISKPPKAAVTFGRIFRSSIRASASGPSFRLPSSFCFLVMKLDPCSRALPASSSFLPSWAKKSLKGWSFSRYSVPWLPFKVMKPVLPVETTEHSIRSMPPWSATGDPSCSRTSPGSTFVEVLPSAISKVSVMDTVFRQA